MLQTPSYSLIIIFYYVTTCFIISMLKIFPIVLPLLKTTPVCFNGNIDMHEYNLMKVSLSPLRIKFYITNRYSITQMTELLANITHEDMGTLREHLEVFLDEVRYKARYHQ